MAAKAMAVWYGLLLLCEAWQNCYPDMNSTTACCTAELPPPSHSSFIHPIPAVQAASIAEQKLGQTGPSPTAGEKDPWLDPGLLHLLQSGTYPPDATQADKDRLAKRVSRFSWSGGKLYQRMKDGSMKQVPPLAERADLVAKMHRRGHMGVKRTLDLLFTSHWWRGMYADVQEHIRRCEVCDRGNASFKGLNKTLNPLPIRGMFYRWHVDLCGEFNATTERYKYIMVAIEAYSKVLEVAPLKDKTPGSTAKAFADIVLGRYGGCAEVVTDRGEWDGAFAELLVDCMIEHRVTSANHPQANGAAERAVQCVKRSLKKMCEEEKTAADWDKHLPWFRLGYNCSRQASTKLAPYTLLYGLGPTIPPAVKEKLEEPVNLDDEQAAAAELLQRQS
eukprot:GHUV01026591.1.p1 GENE.GHUV01026591.1~~GHUV01026591.1.p1  ORF type:complete len:390 (+),score=72.53 GHUV01026591.1:43-1212(+)